MANKRDYYEVLGLKKGASKDDIKSAYRKLAKQYHPDNKETGDEAKFKEVQEAYDILYDDNKRQAYDQFGHAAFEQAGGNPGGNPFEGFSGFNADVDLGDIFSSFFGGGRRQRTNPNAPRRGDDLVRPLKVDFMDAINGKDVTITVDVDETCPNCHGSGAKDANSIKTCPNCNGSGTIRSQRRSLFGMVETQEGCPHCGGTGKIISDKCPNCGGKGYNHKKKDINIHVPAGINNGQQIRVTGMGGRGINGGPNGDLYIEIIVREHASFQRDGNDIHINVPIDFVDAALGVTYEVPTVYGDISLNIAAGTQPGQILRMKGYGVKDLRSGKAGDQYVHLNVKVPTNLSKEQKQLLEEFKNKSKESDSFFSKFKKAFKK